MNVFGVRIPMFASLLLWCAAWELVGRFGEVLFVPPFSEVLVALVDMAGSAKFQTAAVTTLESFAIGMVLAIAIGVPLGVLMGRVRAADRLLGMWVNLFLSAPLTALVPIIMILFGLGQTTIVVTVILFAVWIIALDTQAGIRQVEPSLLEMAASFGASRPQLYAKILFWAALPEILTGIRLGMIRGVKGVVIGQLLVSIIGFGELFEIYSRNFLLAEFWALTIVLFAFAMLLAELIERLERRVEFYAAARH